MIDPRTLPERPPSEVEWEDLLVRLEIAPRAVRLAVEDAVESGALVQPLLSEIVSREVFNADCLEALRTARPFSLNHSVGSVAVEGREPTWQEALEWLAQERGRSFGQLQRRGLEVWDWRSQLVGGGTFTAYQFAQLMAAGDGLYLGRLRQMAKA